MLKENGRLTPADKEELANLKGKCMICPNCGEQVIMLEVSFADTKCKKCDTILVEAGLLTAGKAVGK